MIAFVICVLWSLKEFEGKPKISYVTVFERPGLQEFLNQLSEFAELVLFTAGLEGLRSIKHCFVFVHFHPFICFSNPSQAMLDRLLTELMRKIDLVVDFIGLLQFVRKYRVLHMLFVWSSGLHSLSFLDGKLYC